MKLSTNIACYGVAIKSCNVLSYDLILRKYIGHLPLALTLLALEHIYMYMYMHTL